MNTGDPYFFDLLRECQHPDLRRRLDALETLSKEYIECVDAEFLLFLLRQATRYDEQTAILSMISQLGPRAPLDALRSILQDRAESNPFPRGYVARVLASFGAQAPLDLFISMLQDTTEEAGFREDLAELLGNFGERVPLEVLIAAVQDEEPAVCAAGIEALREQGARAPLEPILAQVAHPEYYVRKAAILALGAARERAPVDPILAALNDPDARVREAAARATDSLLEWFRDLVPFAPLLAALGDEDANVRETVLDVLANHPEYAPLDRVTQALDDSNPYVRCAALLVLERMGRERVPETIYPKLLTMTATELHVNARKFAVKTLFVLKGLPPGSAHDHPGEELF